MCKITRYKFCVEGFDSKRRLPPESTDRCKEYQKLEAEARTGEFMAQRRLVDHLSYSDKWPQVEKVHVSQVLPGGTCVPDPSKVRWNPSMGGNPTDRCYYKRCDGVYRNHSGMRLDYGGPSKQTPPQRRPRLQSQSPQWHSGLRQSPRSPSQLGPSQTELPGQGSNTTPANPPPEQNTPQHSPPEQSQHQRSLPRPIPLPQSRKFNIGTSEADLVTPSTGSATSEISRDMPSAARSFQQSLSQQGS
ncbi:hypothetical protein EPUS_09057 [Endocarpon pusillum Z07020]|uniref:Uncharacterized protein n=1 Tax=Endocarpon pusillum (strain Z07020 / HMAS-L-300199) TaxID=1263415 RepID=U1GDP7_ENDPU|nr:uncharacterized protein EPUS_09057 [Endocarpon pusillum Z07020]ERF69841.1 hypothetical protein EPUS_09057 [Endocarpon pusillum Z07020]